MQNSRTEKSLVRRRKIQECW